MLEELGIGLVPFSPLGKGFLTGTVTSGDDVKGKFPVEFPRFSDGTLEKHQALVDTVKALAARHECTPGQVALAWIIGRLPYAAPIPGTSQAERASENSRAADVTLTQADLDELTETSAKFQVDSVRYPEYMQRMIDR